MPYLKIAASFLTLFALAPAAIFAQTADLRGIYLYTNDVSQITPATTTQITAALSISGIDGLALVIGWDALEPSMGQYQWTLLDQWMGQAIAKGKKVDLVVLSGASTPSWLFQSAPAGPGAAALNFTVTPHNGQTGKCQTVTMAAPWSDTFLGRWDALLSALSTHLKNAGTYNAVTLVRLTGLNRTTEELRLPNETAQSTGLSCITDAIATWQQAGYRPALLTQAWTSILNSFQKGFPDKFFSMSLIPTAAAFPPIADDGSIITGRRPDVTQSLVAAANQKFPAHLIAQFDFLMPGEAVSPDVLTAVQTLGTLAAFQTNEYLGGQGAACGEPVTNPTPCTATTFLDLLETGIYPLGKSNSLRSQYIEVFHDNASAFPADILQAHLELAPPAISLVANAEGEKPTIAPNTWVEIKGGSLSLTGDSRIWKGSDFVNSQLPTQLDNIGVTVNGKPAYVYYISPAQINILTPPDAMTGAVPVVVTNNGTPSASFIAQAQAVSPSLFVFGGGPYVAATHADGSLLGPASLYPGSTTPARPDEVIVLYANGFGPTSTPVAAGSLTQSGTLSPLPVIRIGGLNAAVQFAGLISPGLFQFNVVIPSSIADGDQAISVSYSSSTTPSGTLITIRH